MDFTQQEANDKVGKHVRIIKDEAYFSSKGVTKGIHGTVVSADYIGEGEVAVSIRFFPQGMPEGVLLHYIDKEQYDRSLLEADMAPGARI